MPRDPSALGRALTRDRQAADRFDRFLVGLGVLVLVLAAVFRAALFPFVVALGVAYVLHPFVSWLHRHRVPRWGGTLLSYIIVIGAIVGFVLHVIPKVEVESRRIGVKLNALLGDMPALVSRLEGSVDRLLAGLPGEHPDDSVSPWGSDRVRGRDRSFGLLQLEALPDGDPAPRGIPEVHRDTGGELDVVQLSAGHYRVRMLGGGLRFEPDGDGFLVRSAPETNPDPSDDGAAGFRDRLTTSLQDGVVSLGDDVMKATVQTAQGVATGVVSLLFAIFVVLMAAAYSLIDAPAVRTFLLSSFPARRQDDFQELLGLLDQGLRGVVRGQIMVCLINGVLSFIGFAIFVPDYALVLALVAGVLSFIPVLGSIFSAIPAVLVGLATSLHTALMVLAWILAIHFLEAYILNPKIISHEARLHPVITILAVVAGERVFGVPGAFLAVPTAAVLKALITFAYRRYAGTTAS